MPNDPAALTVIVVIIALVSVIKNVSDMIASWKRSPTVDRDLQNYMPRKELERR